MHVGVSQRKRERCRCDVPRRERREGKKENMTHRFWFH